MFLGIEIGGTKLQIGVGLGDGSLAGLWRGEVDPAQGGEGIRRRIVQAVPELLAASGIDRSRLVGVGIGFGGPVDDATRTVIKSHQIAGWDGFPLADWIGEALHLPAILGNDAHVAGLAEAQFGAGRGMSPVFYITVGSGIGGGVVIDGKIARGTGRGAAEIGHLRILDRRPGCEQTYRPLEQIASGWGIGNYASQRLASGQGSDSRLRLHAGPVTAADVGAAARLGDRFAGELLGHCLESLAEGICHVIALICPRCIVIGGGVALIGEEHFFQPLGAMVAERVFGPFAGLTEIVPAQLGEAVVVHGAVTLACQSGMG